MLPISSPPPFGPQTGSGMARNLQGRRCLQAEGLQHNGAGEPSTAAGRRWAVGLGGGTLQPRGAMKLEERLRGRNDVPFLRVCAGKYFTVNGLTGKLAQRRWRRVRVRCKKLWPEVSVRWWCRRYLQACTSEQKRSPAIDGVAYAYVRRAAVEPVYGRGTLYACIGSPIADVRHSREV